MEGFPRRKRGKYSNVKRGDNKGGYNAEILQTGETGGGIQE